MPITNFCDLQKALQAIQHPFSHKKNQFLRGQIYYKVGNLHRSGCLIVGQQIASHAGLKRNNQVDLTTKSRAEKRGKQPKSQISLAYIKANLVLVQRRKYAKWHEVKIQETELSRRDFYIPQTETKINPILGNTPKKYASQYYQVKVGYDAIRTYLTKIEIIKSSKCW